MLLTDKEINHILDEWGKNPIGDYDTMVAKAQLKKVVEWLEEHHCGHPDGVIPEVPLEISYDDWQVLLKEIS